MKSISRIFVLRSIVLLALAVAGLIIAQNARVGETSQLGQQWGLAVGL